MVGISDSLFGVGRILAGDRASQLVDDLSLIWLTQIRALPDALRTATAHRSHDTSELSLEADLRIMKYWFDPIASGKRLRDVLGSMEPCGVPMGPDTSQLILRIDPERCILTPEGRAFAWALRVSLEEAPGSAEDGTLYLSQAAVTTALTLVNAVYRDWNQQRITSVTGLLTTETATLRPTAAGLLLVLLLNRNTSPDRRLPSPDNPAASAEVSRAIAAPAMAFARELTGTDKSSERGVDLYRGWAMGEIARRLGPGLHRSSDGVWIDPNHEDIARRRLVGALGERPDSTRARLPGAIDAALKEYEKVRSVLSGLGVAHERPSNTRRLVEEILAARGVLPEEGGSK